MRHGLNLMQVNKMDGMSILHLSAATNDVPMLDLVFDTYKKQNKTTKDLVNLEAMTGVTPMQLACLEGNFDSVNLLMEYGADLYQRDE